jgi:thioesterase domain-containing protein/acyl carrier protein
MYTSGTTGAPKGVMIEHRSVLRLVLNTNYIRLGPADRVLQTCSLSFDAATFEIWGALLNGGAVCLPRKESLLDPAELKRLVRDCGITTMLLTTGLFNALAAQDVSVFAGLKTVLCGGERLSPHHINLVRRHHPDLMLLNGYGPTENTTFTTTFDIREEALAEIPIGSPVANTTVHILNSSMEPVAIGAVGELYAGGEGLARGYINDPTLTSAKYVTNPVRAEERLYRTGDLACWRDDGLINYLGRVDEQVKIRGYRIEPGEIETRLLEDERLKQAIVLARVDANQEQNLIAYYTAHEPVGNEELRTHLRRSLPEYMIPAFFVQMKQLPLTGNGKIDRAALPAPERQWHSSSGPQRETTSTEAALIGIWQAVLSRTDIDTSANFFDLGGHSLRAVKLVSLIHEKFGVLLPFTIVFEATTLAELARRIIDAARFGDDSIDQPLVALGAQSGRRTLFAFPPGTADALGYVELAKRVPDSRFYAFNFVKSQAWLGTYVRLMANTQPEEPYVLFGYSGGGNFAFRTAVELERRGKRVGDIIMLDSSRFFEPFRFPTEEARRLALSFVEADGVQPYIKNPALKDRVIQTIERYHEELGRVPDDAVTNANIHLIASSNSPDAFYQDERLICSKSGWAEATRGSFRIYAGFGEHAYMLHHPHLESNAALLHGIFAEI